MGKVYYPRCRAIISVLLDQRDGGLSEDVPTFTVIPREVEIEQNNHRSADRFRMELDFRDFPLDPRALRAVQVTIHLADVKVAGVELPLTRDTLRFFGFADEPETSLSSGGEVVRLSGRDLTGIFLDYRWGGGAVNVNRNLADVVQEIIDTVPAAEGIEVFFLDGTTQFANVAARLGRDRYSPQPNDDAWTVMANICALVGLVPVFVQDRIEIRTATQTQDVSAYMFYGENLSKLTYRRKLNENASKQVQVTAWNTTTATAVVGKWPLVPLVTRKRILKSGKVKTETAPIIPYNVQGIYTAQQLTDLARSIYEEGAREQLEGEFETREMIDGFGDVDLTQLNNGDIVNLRIGKESQAALESLGINEAVARLVTGPDKLSPLVALALVRIWRTVESAATQFYIKRATHRWTRENGYRLVAKFINLV